MGISNSITGSGAFVDGYIGGYVNGTITGILGEWLDLFYLGNGAGGFVGNVITEWLNNLNPDVEVKKDGGWIMYDSVLAGVLQMGIGGSLDTLVDSFHLGKDAIIDYVADGFINYVKGVFGVTSSSCLSIWLGEKYNKQMKKREEKR